MKVSIVIPVYNEEGSIVKLLNHLERNADWRLQEIIVVDGNSEDQTAELLRQTNATCLICDKKGRAAQMNMGHRHSSGDILYFVHADAFPPESYLDDIWQAVSNGYEAGCYRFRFDSDRFLLKVNSWFTRFDRIMCRGGDQTLFITRSLFEKLDGFRDEYIIMEDYDLIQKIRKNSPFKIIRKDVIVSPRKYDHNPYLKVNFANLVVFLMYISGARQQTMVSAYKALIRHPKL